MIETDMGSLLTVKMYETSNNGRKGKWKTAYKRMRVVICRQNQNGYMSEKGVKLLYESDDYVGGSTTPRGKRHAAMAAALKVYDETTKGITDPAVLHDYLSERI